MGYRSATDLSTSGVLMKFYALKAGDSPKVPNIDFSKIMTSQKSQDGGQFEGGVRPPVRPSARPSVRPSVRPPVRPS